MIIFAFTVNNGASLFMNSTPTCLLLYCRNSFASEIATAMLPELQAWEALKNESVVHSKVVQRVEEMSKKHVLEYDALKEKHYQELVKVTKFSLIMKCS